MISSARLGDKHLCPIPGHGITPVASASSDVNINFWDPPVSVIPAGAARYLLPGFLPFW